MSIYRLNTAVKQKMETELNSEAVQFAYVCYLEPNGKLTSLECVEVVKGKADVRPNSKYQFQLNSNLAEFTRQNLAPSFGRVDVPTNCRFDEKKRKKKRWSFKEKKQ